MIMAKVFVQFYALPYVNSLMSFCLNIEIHLFQTHSLQLYIYMIGTTH